MIGLIFTVIILLFLFKSVNWALESMCCFIFKL